MIRLSYRIGLFLLIGVLLSACIQKSGSYSYTYYTGKKNPKVVRDTPRHRQPAPASGFHRIRKGETLYSIAWQYGHDVRDLAIWNGIRAPYTIYPNQTIRVARPKNYVSPPIKKSAPKPVIKNTTAPKPAAKPRKVSKPKPKTSVTNKNRKISWQWPTKGKIISHYSARDSGKKGLDIAGKRGQRVYAAASGNIVYSGNGLRGYGKLIIIKHNETYFSAYAHNKRLLVREDQKVIKGQHIADMGSSEAEQAMLHFEVRRNGKPVDPLRYLPRRH